MTIQQPNTILATLTGHGVPVVVIGGLAVAYHGHVRTTADIDVIWRRGPGVEAALLAALTDLGAVWLADEIDPATGLEREVPVSAHYIAGHHLMALCTRAGYLDLFDYIPAFPGTPVDAVFADAELCAGVRYLSRHWLLRMKRASGRPRDLDDIQHLEAQDNTP